MSVTAWVAAVALLCVQSNVYADSAISNSQKYQPLVEDNELQMRFTDGQNDKLDRHLRSSPHFKEVTTKLTALYSGPNVRTSLKMDATHQIQWIDQGLDQPSVINLIDTTGSAPTVQLYSTFTEGIGISRQIHSLSLSPGGKYLAVVLADYGSIDQMEAVIVDVTQPAVVATLSLFAEEMAWISPSVLSYLRQQEDGSDQRAEYDVANGKDVDASEYVQSSSPDLAIIKDFSTRPFTLRLLNRNTSQSVTLDSSALAVSLIGNDANRAYFKQFEDGTWQVLTLDWKTAMSAAPGATYGLSPLISESKLTIDHTWIALDLVVAQARAGGDRKLRFYSGSTGDLMREVAVPDCCSVTAVSWDVNEKSVNVSFTGAIVHAGTFVYDLVKGEWNSDPNATILLSDGVSYKSEIFNSTSADGSLIPTRFTYRADLKPDGSHPVEIQSYGGFAINGYIDPHFDRGVLMFLKKGGMFAGPAIRGGAEYGEPWHKAAMRENKIKTYQDLDAVAKQLVSNGWTKPGKIAIRGTSNGGLTTAATALLFPTDFGLAIPIAGVDDLLAKDVLDAVNDGWSYEFGSDAEGAAWLTPISPLENASHQGKVRFLIVDGEVDTRVNPAHSVKLAKAMEDEGGNPSNVFLLTVDDAGHGVESIMGQNSIGLKTEIAIWTMVFDMAGF